MWWGVARDVIVDGGRGLLVLKAKIQKPMAGLLRC
jgi:hypothetical protein